MKNSAQMSERAVLFYKNRVQLLVNTSELVIVGGMYGLPAIVSSRAIVSAFA